MYKRVGAAFATVAVAIILGISLSYVPSGTTISLPEEPSSSAAPMEELPSSSSVSVAAPPPTRQYEAPPSSQLTEKGYYIKDWNGRVAILREGEETPEMIFDIYTRLLPEYDQEQLKEGLYVQSYEELTGMIEDYIS